MNIPKNVKYILDELNNEGYEAYIVGGCVRDIIIGRTPNDYDITTSALPLDVKKIFKKTYDTGIEHGTVTVLLDKKPYEITTYRIDGIYEDNRRPKEVEFTKDIIEDLKRRDFNMNAIAYHPEVGFVDPFNGREDIKNEIINCVGNPDERFNEDGLRMLRAIRFSAKLNFKIGEETLKSIEKNYKLINNISYERIRDEFTKTILKEPLKIVLMSELNILNEIMPELEMCFYTKQKHAYHCYNVGMHSLVATNNIEATFVLRWAMLLHDLGKVETLSEDEKGITHFKDHEEKSIKRAKEVMKRFKFDNKSLRKVLRLIKYHERRPKLDKFNIRKFISEVGDDIFLDLLKVMEADGMAKSEKKKEDVILRVRKIKQIYEEIKENNECVDKKHLNITGNDIIKLGFKEGKIIGEILNYCFYKVIEDPSLNKKEKLIELIKRKYLKEG